MTITLGQTQPLVYRSFVKDMVGRDIVSKVAAVCDCRVCKHYRGHDTTCNAEGVVRQIPENVIYSKFSCMYMSADPNKRKKLI